MQRYRPKKLICLYVLKRHTGGLNNNLKAILLYFVSIHNSIYYNLVTLIYSGYWLGTPWQAQGLTVCIFNWLS